MILALSPQLESRLVSEARLNGLTPEAYAEILLRRVLPDTPAEPQPENAPRRAGSAIGLVTIPDDFDEPLEDFKEYMY
ncbi:MAG: DUF2281 domain-containing protein [Fibrella sp.]|nr:DUF2281 domain-containing protein [Armatimonadota bacterium]